MTEFTRSVNFEKQVFNQNRQNLQTVNSYLDIVFAITRILASSRGFERYPSKLKTSSLGVPVGSSLGSKTV